MQLSFEEGKLFYTLYTALLGFVNDKRNILDDSFSDIDGYFQFSPNDRAKVRDELFEHRELIDEFALNKLAEYSAEELMIVKSWKHALFGKFYVYRYMTNYTVFLSTSEPPKAYGVLGLADPLPALVGPTLPRLYEVALLPLRDKIIYDGILNGYNIFFGPGIKRSLKESYQEAKEKFGIITSLSEKVVPIAVPENKTPMMLKGSTAKKIKKPTSSKISDPCLESVTGMINAFCRKHLNEEYAEMCRKLAGTLARKRPSPLKQGKPESWACGIVRTVGLVNFLFDSTQTPYMRATDIDRAFGISPATGAAKSSAIRKLLKIRQFTPKWTLPSKIDDNPLIWLLQVNGIMMDIRHCPREAQVVAFEKGLIPYIPADR
jgi:hypothetical protein